MTSRLRDRYLAEDHDGSRIQVLPSGFDPALLVPATIPADPWPDLPRPRVVFVGDGPERRRLGQLVERSDAGGSMTFTEFGEHRAIPAVLHHADVVVMPSRYEELGSVIVEAMAVGAAVVATGTRPLGGAGRPRRTPAGTAGRISHDGPRISTRLPSAVIDAPADHRPCDDGRCLDVLKDGLELFAGLPPRSVAAVITDPPWNLAKSYGTGAVVLAAARLGRPALGCDLTPAYVRLARQRLRNVS